MGNGSGGNGETYTAPWREPFMRAVTVGACFSLWHYDGRRRAPRSAEHTAHAFHGGASLVVVLDGCACVRETGAHKQARGEGGEEKRAIAVPQNEETHNEERGEGEGTSNRHLAMVQTTAASTSTPPANVAVLA